MLDGDAEYALNRLRPVTRAALYQGERAVRLLLGALLDAVRADRIEMLHLPPDGAHHVRLPVPWLDQSGLVVDLAGGLLAPTVARQAQGLPRFMVLRLRSAAARVAEREGAPAPAKARGAKPGSHPANYGDQRRPLIEAAKALVDVKGLSIRAALIEVVKPPPRKSADDIIRVYREQMKEEDPEWFDRHVQKKGGV